MACNANNAIEYEDLVNLIIEISGRIDKNRYFLVNTTLRRSPLYLPDKGYKLLVKFDCFFDMIKKYASENYIYPVEKECSLYTTSSYLVSFNKTVNETVIELGVYRTGKDNTLYFRLPETKSGIKIDYTELIEGKNTLRAERITHNLKPIEELIRESMEKGVPIQAIIDLLKMTETKG